MSTSSDASPRSHLSVWLAVIRMYQACDRLLGERLRPLGLTVPQYEALARLLHADGLSQGVLGERLLVTKGSVSTLVGRLERDGLVERRSDPDDGRVNRVYLTDRGRSLAARGYAIQEQHVARMLGGLAPSELDAFSQTVRTIERALHEQTDL